ncbi:hypothetical protein GA0070607_0136 [Micromonospora coriariae]|uniref:Uncharacterized protein n=1 Tax=Micromonospora coriariae TaxID=285665 RepID=A0A1C4U4D7_9ACTN|nr:hypothetical protein [Micromonospora coriariae]SCE66583.1 hypothetical protein GA0070607_0136 [Micromonospora coriariae]
MSVAALLAGFAALSPPEGSLAAWAARVGTPDGEFPLIGAGTRAETYVALQWNGERCASLGPAVGPTLVGLAVGAARRRSAAQLSAAVDAGLAAAAEVSTPTVPVSTGVLAATVCAARLAEVPEKELPALLDLAASLMVIGPPGVAPGHDPAAAWLAMRAWDAGITGMPGGLAHTLSVVAAGLPERAAADLDVVDLVEALP